MESRAAVGQHIKGVVLTFRRPGAHGATFLTYALSDVLVTGYAKVQVAFQPAGGGAPVTAGWDVKANPPA